MNLTAQLNTLREDFLNLSPVERARRACDLAKELGKIGEYEKAYEALLDLWPNRSEPPKVDGLDDATAADILLAANAIQEFVAGMTREEFLANFKTQCATVQQILVLGEAAKRLSAEFRQRHSEVPSTRRASAPSRSASWNGGSALSSLSWCSELKPRSSNGCTALERLPTE